MVPLDIEVIELLLLNTSLHVHHVIENLLRQEVWYHCNGIAN